MLNKKLLIITISALFCNLTMLAMEAGRRDQYLTSIINNAGISAEIFVIPQPDWLLAARWPSLAPVLTYKAHMIIPALSSDKDKLVKLKTPILLNEDPRQGTTFHSLYIFVLRRDPQVPLLPTITVIEAKKLYSRSTLVINTDGTARVKPDMRKTSS